MHDATFAYAVIAVLFGLWIGVAYVVWHFIQLKNAYFGGTASMFICEQWLIPFRHFAETVLWHLPGGEKRKAAFIRFRFKADREGCTEGRTRVWHHEEVLQQRLFHECAHDTLERRSDFVKTHALIVLWPLLVASAAVLLSSARGREYLFNSDLVRELL